MERLLLMLTPCYPGFGASPQSGVGNEHAAICGDMEKRLNLAVGLVHPIQYM